MDRPSAFEHHQFVGDKRTQTVYDVDGLDEAHSSIIDEIVAEAQGLCFGPDTLAEARNRGYRLSKLQSAPVDG